MMHKNISSRTFGGVNMKSATVETTDSRPTKAEVSETERMLSVREAAQLQRRLEVSVRRDMTNGKLRRFKCGGRTLLRLSDVLGQIREA